jgi:hypothetical protein
MNIKTHKQSFLNRLLYIVFYILHIHIEYYQYSQNKHDTLKQKAARSFMRFYITYIHATSQFLTIHCCGKQKLRDFRTFTSLLYYCFNS